MFNAHRETDGGDAQALPIPSVKGGRITPASVMMAVMSSCGVTSKAGFQTATPSGAVRTPPTWVTSSGCPLLDGDRAAVGERRIDRGEGGGDVEGDPVRPGEDRQAVGPDLVGRVAVGGDPVRADDDQIDFPLLHQKPAMLSVISVQGIPSRMSSQAVSRAPWRTGRVSST